MLWHLHRPRPALLHKSLPSTSHLGPLISVLACTFKGSIHELPDFHDSQHPVEPFFLLNNQLVLS